MTAFLDYARRTFLDRPLYKKTARWTLSVLSVVVSGLANGAAYRAHLDLSTALAIQFMIVILAALRWGLLQSTIMAIAAAVGLDYFFVPPVLAFSVQDQKSWIALITFEAGALLVSSLSAQMRKNAERGEVQRERTAKLYELSRAILLIDGKQSTSQQLSALIAELMQVTDVAIWLAHTTPASDTPRSDSSAAAALATYAEGINNDDAATRTSKRILRLGTTPIGAMVLCGWETDPLLADAVASVTAVALERARALEQENRAEAARNAEQLRTAVLDGLAHGFKTPLTAIQTASSGLLAIGALSELQSELVSIIDEQATHLAQLTTRLLQTAKLESKDVRLRRSTQSPMQLLSEVLEEQDQPTRSRVRIEADPLPAPIEVDAQLLQLALSQLIDNAIKYSTIATPVVITVSQDLEETRFIVENQGSSIRQEERERIFERFYRGADAMHGPTGTGLGLSIVKKTAEAHQGRTWVESGADRTRFFFTIAGGRKAER